MARQTAKRKGGATAARPSRAKTAKRKKPTKRGFKIKFQGTERFYPFPTSYSLDETIGICEIWGVDNLLGINPDDENIFNPTHVKALVWVMLRRSLRAKDPFADLTIESVGEMNMDDIEYVSSDLAATNGTGGDASPPGPAAEEAAAAASSDTSNSPKSSGSDTED